MAPMYESDLIMLVSGLLSSVPSMVLGVASYVLTALAIYTISRRRGLSKPWLAWIPVVNVWLLGSLSDQYQYVVLVQNRSRRKWLLGLKLLSIVLTVVIAVLGIGIVGKLFFGSHRYPAQIMGSVIGIAGVSLPLVGVAIAYAVIYFIALYDLYKSLDPDNAVLFLVLSILFRITKPFFLFFNRDKDKGMPPRKQEAVFEASPQWQEPVQEPWVQEEKDYL